MANAYLAGLVGRGAGSAPAGPRLAPAASRAPDRVPTVSATGASAVESPEGLTSPATGAAPDHQAPSVPIGPAPTQPRVATGPAVPGPTAAMAPPDLPGAGAAPRGPVERPRGVASQVPGGGDASPARRSAEDAAIAPEVGTDERRGSTAAVQERAPRSTTAPRPAVAKPPLDVSSPPTAQPSRSSGALIEAGSAPHERTASRGRASSLIAVTPADPAADRSVAPEPAARSRAALPQVEGPRVAPAPRVLVLPTPAVDAAPPSPALAPGPAARARSEPAPTSPPRGQAPGSSRRVEVRIGRVEVVTPPAPPIESLAPAPAPRFHNSGGDHLLARLGLDRAWYGG